MVKILPRNGHSSPRDTVPTNRVVSEDDDYEADAELENLLTTNQNAAIEEVKKNQVMMALVTRGLKERRRMIVMALLLLVAICLVLMGLRSNLGQDDLAVAATTIPTSRPSLAPTTIVSTDAPTLPFPSTTTNPPTLTTTTLTHLTDSKTSDSQDEKGSNASPSLNNAAVAIHPNDAPYDPPDWIKPYIAFHHSQIMQKEVYKKDGTTKTKTVLLSSDTRWIQWFCPVVSKGKRHCGGLADRLKGILQALIFALVDDRVLLLEEWDTPPHPLANYLEPNLVDWTAKRGKTDVVVVEGYRARKENPHSLFDALHLHPCYFRNNTEYGTNHDGVRFSGNYFTKEKIVKHEDCLKQLFQDHPVNKTKDTALHATLFWTLFRFSQATRDEANRLRGDLIPNPNYYVAAHIRTGNGTDWSDPLIHNTNAEWDEFSECITDMQNAMQAHCQGNNPPPAYLASDNEAVKAYVKSQHAPGTLQMAQEVEIMHIDRSRSTQNATAAYGVVLAEFKILMDATCLILSNSGFSNLALSLSRIQPRCALLVQECSDPVKVQKAVQKVKCPS